jgi:hypothetical protein
MPLTITLTIPDADVPRLQAALTAGGQQPKQALQAFLVSLVQGYEQQQQLSSYAAGYKPIVPS